jgi:hypothetical protein
MSNSSAKRTSRNSVVCTQLPLHFPRPSVFEAKTSVVKVPNGCYKRTVAIPSEEYAAYLQTQSRLEGLTLTQSRWKTVDRLSCLCQGVYRLCLDELPEGWTVFRYYKEDPDLPGHELTTMLHEMPVAIPTFELAAQLAQSPELVAFANLCWRSETQRKSKSDTIALEGRCFEFFH